MDETSRGFSFPRFAEEGTFSRRLRACHSPKAGLAGRFADSAEYLSSVTWVPGDSRTPRSTAHGEICGPPSSPRDRFITRGGRSRSGLQHVLCPPIGTAGALAVEEVEEVEKSKRVYSWMLGSKNGCRESQLDGRDVGVYIEDEQRIGGRRRHDVGGCARACGRGQVAATRERVGRTRAARCSSSGGGSAWAGGCGACGCLARAARPGSDLGLRPGGGVRGFCHDARACVAVR